MKKCSYTMLIFVLAAGGACAAQSDQPSLGDVAKKTRQEKKAVKVLTNDDVATVTPDASSQSPKGATSSAPAASESAAKSPDKAKGTEKTATASKDPPEIAELKQKLTSYQQEQEGWKKSAKKYEDLLATETSDFRRQMYQDALEGDKQNVQVFQNKIDQAQSELEKAEKASSQGH